MRSPTLKEQYEAQIETHYKRERAMKAKMGKLEARVQILETQIGILVKKMATHSHMTGNE